MSAFKNPLECDRGVGGTCWCVINTFDRTVIERARLIALRNREHRHESELCADGSREPDDVEKLENSAGTSRRSLGND